MSQAVKSVFNMNKVSMELAYSIEKIVMNIALDIKTVLFKNGYQMRMILPHSNVFRKDRKNGMGIYQISLINIQV